MKLILFIFLFTLSLSSRAQDLNLEENKYLGYIYQQTGYQLHDPQGDILLLWTAHQIPQFIMSHLKGEQEELLKFRQQKIEELLTKYPQFLPIAETKNLIVENYITFNPEHVAIELEGHKAPFKVRNMSLMMKQVIAEEYQLNGIRPQLGEVNEWCQEILPQLLVCQNFSWP